ncbi:ATP-binding domain-containing protein [Speluncibacter jeojiensis]|uniref:AAA family ATPase n=1 Tax=Speluncibacter jeojiensis TaxID=2710754 RepID=A0A9X4LXX0_9ACTN|nr:ATP-binding domain-containing protein [Rhodococcus sp. D2-41]MDG3013631.1 AAA family ATPase [Corynebacteriales bacterium D3-21]
MTDNTGEIAAEQAHLTTLYQHLDALRVYARSRLSTVLLESGGTPQARSERESFSAMYAEDLAKYDAAENGLCFGRLDMADGETRHIGRLGLLDEDNDYETLLLDWRAPLARPFYLATPASPDGVSLRRHIRSRGRTVTSIGDEHLDLREGDSGTGAGGVAGEGALLDALNAARTGQMNDIVETIQGEQDRIIRSEHKSVMVVQGGPGTGKTAVALHRAAYLLYTYRKQLARSGVLIIGPNETFLDYIGQVLPSLGETGVLLSTIGNLYPGVHATVEDSIEAGTIKGSTDMVDVLRNAVRDRQQVPTSPIEIRYDTYTLALDRKMCTRARGRARSSRRPHNLARPLFASMIVDALAEKFAAVVGENLVDGSNLLSRSDIADIRDEMRHDPEVLAAIDRLWPELTPQQVLSDLLRSAKRLATAAPELTDAQRAALLRTAAGFSAADAPLLDELAELLGIDESAEQDRRARQWRKQIADAQGALDILTGSAPQDLEDDLDPEILMAYDLIDAGQLAERQRSTDNLTTAERAAGDRTWTYGHVIVDEAQELSEMAWRMLMRRCPNRWMTVVGDTAQTGDPAGSSSWNAVLEPYVAQRWKLHELTVNYRTPSEIMDVATGVLERIAPEQTPPRSIRSSGRLPWARKVRPDEHLDALRAALAEVPAGRLSAVLVPNGTVDDYRELTAGEVSVLTVGQAKGLEFDAVFIVEPQAIVDESSRGLNDLYVALTRATQQLGIVHSLDLPPVLDGLAEAAA